MIDNYTQLQEILKVFTYRPGWKFQIRDEILIVKATVIDADDTSRTTPLSFARGIPRLVNDSFPWDIWLFDIVIEIERHEAREFFKIGGVKVFDPHAGDE